MSGLTDWLRRRGEYPGPGAPAAPVPATPQPALLVENDELATELSVERQHSDELESEIAALSRELIAVAHRSAELRRMVEASPEQVRRNCLALSDRNAELRRDLNDLTKRHAELERESAVFGVVSP